MPINNYDKDQVFGVMKASEANIKDMELLYEVEHRQAGDPNYLRQRVYRDKDGKYYLYIEGGATATAMLSIVTWYYPNGREVLIPIRPEALSIWAQNNLRGKEYGRALEEFMVPAGFEHMDIWLYQQGVEEDQGGYVYERLWKTDGGFYILFSTEYDYPCPGYNVPIIGLDEDGACRDDLYIYYITPETARRWAEARGMSEVIYRKTFGGCAA